ncbi:MAG: VCBS repeat-containing protein [Candidatus Kapaibacterium sp.]|nr:VCBS repeat-containing protein [Ignavibacteria bacterium]
MTLTTLIQRSQGATAALVLLLVLQFTLSEPASSQVVEEIRANPELWTLRSIWKVTGQFSGNQVGLAISSLGKLPGDSVGSFAVHYGDVGDWKVYRGVNQSDPPIWEAQIPTPVPSYTVVGDFYGDGRGMFVIPQDRFWDDPDKYWLYFYPIEEGGISETIGLKLDPLTTMTPPVLIGPREVIAEDMDGEKGDELLLSISVTVREGVRSQVGEIWLYKGGADFQVDQPTHVIVDEQANTKEDEYRLFVADFDGDSFADLILTARYADGSKLKLWFGNEGSPWNWTNTPDRTLFIDGLGLSRQLSVADFDGDRIVDIAASVGNAPEPGTYIYLSSKGKSVRDRSFNYSDADVELQSTQYQIPIGGGHGGYLADSSGRYAMLGLIGPSKYDSHEAMLLLFGGGKNGPNGTWDAEYAPSRDGVTPGPVMQHIVPIGDCDGDGWSDLLLSDDDWYLFDHGIAMVIAGGPEIPTDDTTLSVRAVSTEEHRGALHIWPNPMGDELQIVWRGDLLRMPSRFTVHNALGELVAEGEVEPGVGAARWESQDSPSGLYLLTVYDSQGEVLATTEVVKTE